jgi:hypothetical protein
MCSPKSAFISGAANHKSQIPKYSKAIYNLNPNPDHDRSKYVNPNGLSIEHQFSQDNSHFDKLQ